MVLEKILESTHNLLEKEGSWIQHDAAEDQFNKLVHPHSDEACKFCLLGAIDNASNALGNSKFYEDAALELALSIREEHPKQGLTLRHHESLSHHLDVVDVITSFNDNKQTTHQEVINLLRTTITKLKKG